MKDKIGQLLKPSIRAILYRHPRRTGMAVCVKIKRPNEEPTILFELFYGSRTYQEVFKELAAGAADSSARSQICTHRSGTTSTSTEAGVYFNGVAVGVAGHRDPKMNQLVAYWVATATATLRPATEPLSDTP